MLRPSSFSLPDHMRMRTALAVSACVLTVWSAAFEMTWSAGSIAIVSLELSLLVLSIWLPRCSMAAFLIVDSVNSLLPFHLGMPSLFGVLLALGMLAYDTTDMIAAAVTAAMILVQAAQTVLYDDMPGLDIHNLPSFVVMFSLMALLGRSCRWMEERSAMAARMARAEEHIADMQRKAAIADRIHDAVTGDLSALVQLSRRQLYSDDDESWRLAERYAVSALENMHKVIDQLEDDGIDKGVQPISWAKGIRNIHTVFEQCDERLRGQGYIGKTTFAVRGQPSNVTEADVDMIVSILRECCANIIRHGSAGGEYMCSVSIDSIGCDITQTNMIDDTKTTVLPGGHGLSYWRDRLDSINGRLDVVVDNGQWGVHAWIPFATD